MCDSENDHYCEDFDEMSMSTTFGSRNAIYSDDFNSPGQTQKHIYLGNIEENDTDSFNKVVDVVSPKRAEADDQERIRMKSMISSLIPCKSYSSLNQNNSKVTKMKEKRNRGHPAVGSVDDSPETRRLEGYARGGSSLISCVENEDDLTTGVTCSSPGADPGSTFSNVDRKIKAFQNELKIRDERLRKLTKQNISLMEANHNIQNKWNMIAEENAALKESIMQIEQKLKSSKMSKKRLLKSSSHETEELVRDNEELKQTNARLQVREQALLQAVEELSNQNEDLIAKLRLSMQRELQLSSTRSLAVVEQFLVSSTDPYDTTQGGSLVGAALGEKDTGSDSRAAGMSTMPNMAAGVAAGGSRRSLKLNPFVAIDTETGHMAPRRLGVLDGCSREQRGKDKNVTARESVGASHDKYRVAEAAYMAPVAPGDIRRKAKKVTAASAM